MTLALSIVNISTDSKDKSGIKMIENFITRTRTRNITIGAGYIPLEMANRDSWYAI